MKAVIYKTKKSADNLQEDLFNAIKGEAPKGTDRYCNVMKHPTELLWAVPVKLEGYYSDKIKETLGSRIVVELTPDW